VQQAGAEHCVHEARLKDAYLTAPGDPDIPRRQAPVARAGTMQRCDSGAELPCDCEAPGWATRRHGAQRLRQRRCPGATGGCAHRV